MNRFLRNVSSNYAVAAVHGVLLLLVTPIVVRGLGLEHYAVWIIIQTIGYFLGFLDFGLTDAQVRQHARLSARGERQALGRLHGTVLTLFAGAGLLAVLLAAAIAALPSAALLDIPATALDSYALLLLLVGLATAAAFIDVGFDGIFEGHQRYDLKNLVNAVGAVLDAVLVVAALWHGYGLVALATIKVVTTLLGAAAKAVLIRRRFPASFPVAGFDREAWRSVRGYTFWNSLNELASEGTAHLDKLLIPVLLASALVTPYTLVCMVAAVIFVLAEPITDTFLPIASHRHSREDSVGLAVLLVRGTRLVMTATLPTAVVVLFFGDAFLDLWVGEEFTDVSPLLLWFTAASFLFSAFLWTTLIVLMGAGLIRQVFRFTVMEVLLALGLILVLAPSFGLPGLALATLIANVWSGIFWLVPAACRVAGMEPASLLRQTLIRPLLAVLPACALAVAFVHWQSLDGWLGLIGASAATGAVGLAALLAFSVTRWERLRYLAILRQVLGR